MKVGNKQVENRKVTPTFLLIREPIKEPIENMVVPLVKGLVDNARALQKDLEMRGKKKMGFQKGNEGKERM